jgi:hypothetical protein
MRLPRFTIMNLLILTTSVALLLSQLPLTSRGIHIPKGTIVAGIVLLVVTVWVAMLHRSRTDRESLN